MTPALLARLLVSTPASPHAAQRHRLPHQPIFTWAESESLTLGPFERPGRAPPRSPPAARSRPISPRMSMELFESSGAMARSRGSYTACRPAPHRAIANTIAHSKLATDLKDPSVSKACRLNRPAAHIAGPPTMLFSEYLALSTMSVKTIASAVQLDGSDPYLAAYSQPWEYTNSNH